MIYYNMLLNCLSRHGIIIIDKINLGFENEVE